MTLYSFDVPEDAAQLPGWLERHLVGLDLAQLVAELTAVHGAEERSGLDLDRLLGAQSQAVLSQGLGALSHESLRQLLIHPRLLLELQELVLREGGRYWDTIAPDAAHVAHVQRGAANLQKMLAGQARPVKRSNPRSWFVGLAVAATFLAAFVAYEELRRRPGETHVQPPPQVVSTEWGWNKLDALPEDVSRSTYLTRLADRANDWFQERPTDAVDLARRIHEFRAGCTRLIFAEHRPLPPEDRQWLIEKCRVWGRKLDKQLAALESGEGPVEVRDQTDVLIHQVIAELREQAKKAA